MYRVTKCFEFEAAHQLTDTCNEGCKHIHGHSYKLEVTLSAEELWPSKMVRDFTEINRTVKSIVLEDFDHAFIKKAERPVLMGSDGPYSRFEKKERTMELLEQPTAEYMCFVIFQMLKRLLPQLTKVRLWETSTSYAEYEEVL